MTLSTEPSSADILDCELCVVGAGYAALNGLNAAAKYLKQGARVVVIDKNESWGGQWVRQYDFVRLHQPYRMFTAGDQPWTLARDPSYLATRREVLDHLGSVPGISAGHLEIKPLFGHAYQGHRIREGRAEIDAVPLANGQGTPRLVRIRARRLLKAIGTNIEMLPPFPLSSTRVRSVGVSDPVLMTREFLDSKAPVYIIGSGKTAMDCVRHVANGAANGSAGSRRSLNIVTGSGMWFFSRDHLYPRGARRFVQGALAGELFLRMCQHFDGQNEVEVMRGLARAGSMINVFGEGGNCRYGMLSLAERSEILASVDQVYGGHLVDVDGTEMTLREGKQQRAVPVAEGAWFINCTSHLRYFPHEAVLQDSGIVCAPQYMLGFTGTSAYYGTHLWYRDELAPIAPELFRLRIDIEPKLRFAPQMGLMVLANMAMVRPRLPLSVPSQFLGDFNKWYPLPRQLLMIGRLIKGQEEVRRKADRLMKLRFSDSPDPA
jgi:hypothetical protein